MSAPRKIWADIVGESNWQHVEAYRKPAGYDLYHHDDVVQQLRKALEEIVEHCRNSGRGCVAVNDRIYERCEETAMEALAKIAQEG